MIERTCEYIGIAVLFIASWFILTAMTSVCVCIVVEVMFGTILGPWSCVGPVLVGEAVLLVACGVIAAWNEK
jgi:hypothetical protein